MYATWRLRTVLGWLHGHLVRAEQGKRTEILVALNKGDFTKKITYGDHKAKVFLPEI